VVEWIAGHGDEIGVGLWLGGYMAFSRGGGPPGGRFRLSDPSSAAFRAATRAFRRVAAIETRT